MASIVDSLTSLLTSRGAAGNGPDPLAVIRQWTTKTGMAVRRYEVARRGGDEGSAGAALQETIAFFATAPVDAIGALPGSVSRFQREVAGSVVARMGELLTQTRNQLDDPTARPDLGQAQSTLAEVEGNLETLARRISFNSGAAQVLKVAAYALPIVAGYLIAVYFRFTGGGLYAENHSVLSPLLAYDGKAHAAQLTFVPEFEKNFWGEFSRYYFRRDNSFERLVHDGNVQLKLVFRNPRKADPLIVSTIQTAAKFTAQPFAWKNVDATARVEAKQDEDSVVLSDKGVGPAVDLQYQLDAANMRLIDGKSEILYRWNQTIRFSDPTGNMAVVRGRGSELWPEVYHRNPEAWGDLAFDCPDGSRWESIADLQRLNAITPTIRGGEGTLTYDYASLRGDRLRGKLAVALPDDLTYFKRSDILTDAHPCPPPTAARPARPTFPTTAMPGPDEILDKLTPGTSSLKGVDLIVKRMTINLASTEDDRTTAVVDTPDEILNPGGFLIVYLTLEQPKNGKVDVALHVNGIEVRTLTVPLLIPDRMHFDRDELAEERKRFAAK